MGEAIGPDEGRDHVCRQTVVAMSGQRALSTDDTSALATTAAVEWLNSLYAGVFEPRPEGRSETGSGLTASSCATISAWNRPAGAEPLSGSRARPKVNDD